MSDEDRYFYHNCCSCSDDSDNTIVYPHGGCGCPYLASENCESESIQAYMCGEMDETDITTSPPNVYKTVKNLYNPNSSLYTCTSGCLNMADRFVGGDPFQTREYEREIVYVYHPSTGELLYSEVHCTNESETSDFACQGYEFGGEYYSQQEEEVTNVTLCNGSYTNPSTPCFDRTDLSVDINNAKKITTLSESGNSNLPCTLTRSYEGNFSWSQSFQENCYVGDMGAPTILSVKKADTGTVPYAASSHEGGSGSISSSAPQREEKYDYSGGSCEEAQWDEIIDTTPDYIRTSSITLGSPTVVESSLLDHGNQWNSNGYMYADPDSETSALADSAGTRHETTDGDECTSLYELRVSRTDFTKRTARVDIVAHNLMSGSDYTACVVISRREAFAMSSEDLANDPDADRGAWEDVEVQTVNFTYNGSGSSYTVFSSYELPNARGYEYAALTNRMKIFRTGMTDDTTEDCVCPEVVTD